MGLEIKATTSGELRQLQHTFALLLTRLFGIFCLEFIEFVLSYTPFSYTASFRRQKSYTLFASSRFRKVLCVFLTALAIWTFHSEEPR
jgi:hypothetical protein